MGHKALTGGSLAAILLITSCANGDQSSVFRKTGARNPVETTYNHEAARVLLLDQCPVVIQPPDESYVVAPVLLALAPIIANVAVGAISTYLEKMQTQLTANYAAFGAADLFTAAGSLAKNCLVIARGDFGADWVDDAGAAPGSLTREALEPHGFAGYPAFYLQAALRQEDGQKYSVIMEPEVLHFADTAARRRGSGEKTIGVFLTLNTTAPGPTREAAEKEAVATVPFEFRDVPIGTEYRLKDGEDPVANPLFDQRRIISFQSGEGAPEENMNFYAFITETEDTPAFYKLLNDAFTANKPGLEKAIQEVITDAIKKANGETEAGEGS